MTLMRVHFRVAAAVAQPVGPGGSAAMAPRRWAIPLTSGSARRGGASARVLSDTYTQVLMDERELDYAVLLAERSFVQKVSQFPS